MGTVVTLPPQRRRRRAAARASDDATILLFLGVRYVRDDEPDPVPERPRPALRAFDGAPLALA